MRSIPLLAVLLSGCAPHVRYSTGPVERGAPIPATVVVSGLLDARADGGPSDVPLRAMMDRRAAFGELSGSLQDHLQKAGVLGAHQPLAELPESADEVSRVLADAAHDHADEVWFVRLVDARSTGKMALGVLIVNAVALATAPIGGIGLAPLLLADSLPVNHESGGAAVEVVVVDPATGEVLARAEGEDEFDNHPTVWAFNDAKECWRSVRTSVDEALRGVADQRDAGFPDRQRVDDVAGVVLHGAAVDSRTSSL